MEELQNIGIAADSPNTVTLPEHLIIDHILPRLPVKTLIRLKLVSKFWLSTISSRQFAKSHLEFSLSSSSCNQALLLVRIENEKYRGSFKLVSVPYDELNNLKTPVNLGFPLSFDPNTRAVEIVGSSNGLVCLRILMSVTERLPPPRASFGIRNTSCSFLYVYNPATKENRKIDNPDYVLGLSSRLWFGYIPSIDDYKIVASFFRRRGYDHRVYVYSLRMGKWMVINDLDESSNCVSNRLFDTTTIIDDILYWSLLSPGFAGRPKRIVGFDFVNDQLKEAPLMDCFDKYNAAIFFVLNGCLSLLCCCYSTRIRDVWMLKRHGDWSSWEKSFSVKLGDMDYIHCVTPSGKFMVGSYCKQLKIVGLNKDTLELSQGDAYFSEEEITCAIGYVESLVSPFGTIESNEEEGS